MALAECIDGIDPLFQLLHFVLRLVDSGDLDAEPLDLATELSVTRRWWRIVLPPQARIDRKRSTERTNIA